jgi:hypothetical protein
MTTQHLVPGRWRDDFVLTLRLRDVSGTEIGDALAHVESYCAESGETAAEAFGDAREYAGSLPFDERTPQGDGVSVRQLVLHGVSLGGMFVTVAAVTGWISGQTPSLTAGILAATVLVVLTAALVARWLEPVVRHPWLAGLTLVPLMGATGAALLLLDQRLLSVPPVPMVVFGLLLLCGPSVLATAHRDTADADLVVSPLDDPERTRRAAARSTLVVAWIIPVMAIPAIALAALVSALAESA